MSRIYEALQRVGAVRATNENASVLDELVDALRPSGALRERPREAVPVPSISEVLPKQLVTDAGIALHLDGESRLVAWNAEHGLAAEKFRVLATRLTQIKQKRPLKKLLVTSAVKGEGKSLVAANLALTIARRAKQRVLLIDADLREPSLGPMFGTVNKGINEWWAGTTTLRQCLYRVADTSLILFPAVRAHEQPLEILQSPRFQAMLDQLSAEFDWIIIDAPPSAPFADAAVLSAVSDGIMLVVRSGKTPPKLLVKIAATFDQARLLGVVLNASSEAEERYYSAQYSITNRQKTKDDLQSVRSGLQPA